MLAALFVSRPQQALAVDEDLLHSTFAGSLLQPAEGNEDDEVLRSFEVQMFSSGNEHFFHVIDDSRVGCPWPDSYGQTGPEIPIDRVQPHLVYPYDAITYVIGLPPLVISLPENIAADATWEQAGWQMTAIEQRSADGGPTWTIEARERRGRQQTLTVDAASAATVRAEADVFMGQGDQFRMTLVRTSVKPLNAAVAASVRELERELLSLQAVLKRRPDAFQSELSARQVSDVMASADRLTTLAKDTPLESLVRQLRTDTEQQQKRLTAVASRAGELMNSAAPTFALNLVSGGTLESVSLRGKTVILHFWDYRDAPLSEPYGQTGYLEFLFSQKKKKNVEVIGISTNPDFHSTENLPRGRRAARKLSEFMNLSYPIGHDDGALLKSFGDPRDTRGQLPLWIVLNAEGKVVHYHAGFYEVDSAQGLKELEAVLADVVPAGETAE